MAKTALEKYERILGPNPEAAEDVRKLGEQLERAEQEKSRLKLQLQEAEEVSQRSAWGFKLTIRPRTLCTPKSRAFPSCGKDWSRL